MKKITEVLKCISLILILCLSMSSCGIIPGNVRLPDINPPAQPDVNTPGQPDVNPVPPEVENPPAPEVNGESQEPWRDAYTDFLKTQIGNGRFGFVYVNDDDIPEIVICDGDYHVSSVKLYTYENGSVQRVLEDGGHEESSFGVYGSFIYKERGSMIYIGDMHMGYIVSVLIEMDGSNANYICTLRNNEGAVMDESEYEYTFNDAIVTKAEYDEMYIKYGFDRIESEYDMAEYSDMKDITAENAENLDV